MYLVMLPKTLRPSSTPSPSTARLFSSKMMSAVSLAMSTALSTEMPTSAAFRAGPSLMPSPRKPTTCPFRCKASMIAAFCDGETFANTAARLGQVRQLSRATAPRSRCQGRYDRRAVRLRGRSSG